MKTVLILLLYPNLPLSVSTADRLPPMPVPCITAPQVESVPSSGLRQIVENDWIRNLERPVTTQSDAAGACDGVMNGTYGFHTGLDAYPWWQVDLGERRAIGRIVVYNRLDYAPGLHNADTMQILASDDGKEWKLRHDNSGRHFGGIQAGDPLSVSFGDEGLNARYIRLSIPSPTPIFFHLDEVEVYAVGDDTNNIALKREADQCSLSPWSTAKSHAACEYPIQAYIERARREGARLAAQGLDVSEIMTELDEASRKLAHLPETAGASGRALYIDVRWILRRLVLRNPLLVFDRLLFVKRFTQETYPDVCLNHMPWVSRPGGDICVLQSAAEERGLFCALADLRSESPRKPALTQHRLLNQVLGPGHVHGLDLWFDGSRVVFGYARSRTENPPDGWLDRTQSYRLRREEEPIHLFELSLEHRSVRQLTDGEWSDLDPTYAPNGDIVFVSERCGTSLQCNEYDKDETSCNLYVVKPDGSGIRRLSVNKDGDYLPHCLDNGMIAYTRWEYHERSWAYIQSIWVIRPDGTGADALFKQHFVDPWALEDVRSIPGSSKLVAIAAGHHTLPVGPLVIVNHHKGINEPQGIGIVTPNIKPPEGGMDGITVPEGGTSDPDGFYGTPWALSEECFLVSYTYGNTTTEPAGYGLYFVDVHGNKELLYRDTDISCFAPIPLRPRPFPPILPDTTLVDESDAVCVVSHIAYGCEDVAADQIGFLRIAEPIGWPYDNEHGGQRYGEDHRYGGPDAERRNLTNWTPVRILGDVPVQPDGSVRFKVPPDTAVYFQLLDKNRMEVRRMRSFVSFQAGEVRGCVGCHETRAVAAVQPELKSRAAHQHHDNELIPPPWGSLPISFLRDVQPVLDRQCVTCHMGLRPAAGLDFAGGLISYDDEVPGYGHNRAFETILANNLVAMSPARRQDASITPPYAYGAHKSKLFAVLNDKNHVKRVTLTDEERLRLTMWIDANAPYHDHFVNKRSQQTAYDLPADKSLYRQLHQLHERRCASCHTPEEVTRLDWIDLNDPERSLFLIAPLAQSAGGTQACGEITYSDPEDPDYEMARELVQAAVARAWSNPRRDLLALEPPASVVSYEEYARLSGG